MDKQMKNGYYEIVITYGNMRKVIKRTPRSFIDPVGYATGYLSALSDRGIDVSNIDVEVHLCDNNGKYAEVMPAQSIKKELLS